MNNKQLYKITLTREQLMLISRCVEDISRYAAGDMDLQHTTETLIDDMDRTESLGIRSFIANNSMAIRRMIGDASGKEGQFSDSDKKTAENFGCEYMDVDDFVYKYNNR